MDLLLIPRKILRKLKQIIVQYTYIMKTSISFSLAKKKKKSPHNLPSELIISLTSFPARYKTLHLTLKCLLLQNIHVDKVILWIAHDDFESLPKKVLDLQKYGLLILKTEDIRSYKKIIPTLGLYPESYIVTVDDDLYYPSNLIENLLKKYQKNPGQVIASRTHLMKFDENNDLLPYKHWGYEKFDNNNPLKNFFTSGAGTLFPPNVFHEEVFNSPVFLEVCPTADDIWLNWMVAMNGVKIFHTEKIFKLITWPSSQKFALNVVNVSDNDINNDVQISKLITHYDL